MKLGANYSKLWTAAAISTLGDGIRLVALPLLTATLTRSPTLVSLVTLAGRLPWMLFALVAGALVDRWDRRRVMWIVDAARMGLMAGLGVAVLAGWARFPILVIVAFLLGTGETLFDNAAQAFLPSIVERSRLETANSYLFSAQLVSMEFLGPPVGSFLFAAVAALPFFADATSFGASVLLVLSVRGLFRIERPTAATSLSGEVREALRWLWAHRVLRTLGLMLGALTMMWTAVESILVLFALEKLHIGPGGYGLLFSAGAVGALIGSLLATRLARAIGRGAALILAAVMWGATTLVIGLSSNPFLAGAMLALGGLFGSSWNVITVSLRQSIVPERMLGRVNSAYRFLGWGPMPIGALIGGLLASGFGLRAPILIAGSTFVLVGLIAIPIVNNRSIEDARREAGIGEGALTD